VEDKIKQDKIRERQRIESLLFPYGVTRDFNLNPPLDTQHYFLMDYEFVVNLNSSVYIRVYKLFELLQSRVFFYGSFSENDAASLFSFVYEACLLDTTIEKGVSK